MALTGLGWRSLDAVEAVAAVHAVEDRKELYRIAEEAMHPEARRLALLKLGDKEKMSHAARWDISPVVRRRMVRELDDEAFLSEIAESDKDQTVTDAALERLKELQSVCTIHITGGDVPPLKTEDPIPEWNQIYRLFADELNALRHSLPRKSRFFSKTEIEPLKYSADREVLLLRTTVIERDGSMSLGAAVLNLETGEYYFQDGALAYYTKKEMESREGNNLLLDMNRGGWRLLTGYRNMLRIIDIADKRGRILLRDGPVDFASFLENDQYILCRQGQAVYVIEAESGMICTKKMIPADYDDIYIIDDNAFILRHGNSSILCWIKWNLNKVKKKDNRVLNRFG